jgi:hypothetical protein
MTQAKEVTRHTPGPWKFFDSGLIQSVEPCANLAETDIDTWIPKSERLANAAFIVKAVNSHDQLVAALEALIAETIRCDKPGIYGVSQEADVVKNAQAALARVKDGE